MPADDAGQCQTCGERFSPKGLAIHRGIKHNPRRLGVRLQEAWADGYASGKRDARSPEAPALDWQAIVEDVARWRLEHPDLPWVPLAARSPEAPALDVEDRHLDMVKVTSALDDLREEMPQVYRRGYQAGFQAARRSQAAVRLAASQPVTEEPDEPLR